MVSALVGWNNNQEVAIVSDMKVGPVSLTIQDGRLCNAHGCPRRILKVALEIQIQSSTSFGFVDDKGFPLRLVPCNSILSKQTCKSWSQIH